MYRCPICDQPLREKEKSAQCIQGHNFDRAKSGYFNFLLKNQASFRGDHPSQIEARRQFLSHHHYLPLAQKINEILLTYPCSVLIDAGCGEGYYTQQMKLAQPQCEVYGFDISKDAVDKATKKDKSIHFCVSSVNRLPYQNLSADIITSLFAPVDENEFARVLKNDGILLVVSAHPDHLIELKQVAYDTVLKHEHQPLESSQFTLIQTFELAFEMHLSQPDITTLFAMTPYGFRTSVQGKQLVETKENLTVTAKFILETYQKNR
jgi:23S rRNA (guanine745-N1)-methyltransferase